MGLELAVRSRDALGMGAPGAAPAVRGPGWGWQLGKVKPVDGRTDEEEEGHAWRPALPRAGDLGLGGRGMGSGSRWLRALTPGPEVPPGAPEPPSATWARAAGDGTGPFSAPDQGDRQAPRSLKHGHLWGRGVGLERATSPCPLSHW